LLLAQFRRSGQAQWARQGWLYVLGVGVAGGMMLRGAS
jgi:hypothetical protein